MLFTKAIKETLSGFYHWSRQHEDTTGPHMHKGSNAEYLHCLFQIALHKHAVLYYFLLFYVFPLSSKRLTALYFPN